MMKTLDNLLVLLMVPMIFSFHPDQSSNKDNRWISDTLDAIHYAIHLNILNPSSHEIDGFTVVTLTPRQDHVDRICLELLQLQIDSVFVDEILSVDYIHHDPLLEISLSDPLSTDDTVAVRIHYHGEPFHENWGGFHFAGSFAYNLGVGFVSNPHNLGKAWFPCIDDFRDRAMYDCHIRVNDAQTAVCGGVLLEIEDHPDETRTYHWQLLQTIPTYLASVAVGDYFLVEDTCQGILDDIPITYYVRSVDLPKVAGTFVHLHEIFHTFEEHFGAYSWPRIGYVSTENGAMEHATNIAYPYGFINGGLSYEWLYAHELSHMWFGDKVTCASAEDMWINEGWATFCESLYREGIYGRESYMEHINALHAEVLQKCHTPLQDNQYFALYGIPHEYTYGYTVYDKGSLVVHTLRGYLGDSLFFAGVKGFLEAFAFQAMSSFDLRDHLSFVTGMDMTGFFDAWVFTPGFPHFATDSFEVSRTGELYDVTVFVRQKYKGADALANDNRVEVCFMDQNRQTAAGLMVFSGQTGIQTFQLPFEPVMVILDPDDKMADATSDFLRTINETGTFSFPHTHFTMDVEAVNDSVTVFVTHHWVAPDSLKNPMPGLRLSDYRYWSIDGIFPEGFSATGKFSYNRNGYLDNTLIMDAQDSLVILYRPDVASDWQSVDFTKYGPWHLGTIMVEGLQKGEYTLAIYDHTVGSDGIFPSNGRILKVYPNPTGTSVTIHYELSGYGKILICDTGGKLCRSFEVLPDQTRISCSTHDLTNGLYYIHLQSSEEKVIGCEKLIVLN